MSRVRIPSPAFRSGTEGFASRPSLVADSLPSQCEVRASNAEAFVAGIRTSQSSVRIPSPALFVMLVNSSWSLALMLQTRACCADSGAVQKQRLQIDTRKWILSKLLPKKYGDLLGLDHKGDGLTLNVVTGVPESFASLEQRRLKIG